MKLIEKYIPFIRVAIGALITLHGLYRMLTISLYTDFILDNFSDGMLSTEVLMLGGTFLPFVEFLCGILILFRISIKQTTVIAGLLSLLMLVFIIIGDLAVYRLIYHIIVICGLIYIYRSYRAIILNERFFKFSKR